MAPLFPAPTDVTKTKGSNHEFVPPLTTLEHHQRDEMIMAHVYGLEVLRKRIECLAYTVEKLSDVADMYPLNAHAKTVLGIEPSFFEPVDDDVHIVEDNLQTGSDVDTVFNT
uniref:Uncharacterized protein n=1 Tax=Solanum tuberosum TaxID=4113 RepID=M1DFT2_SOLTU